MGRTAHERSNMVCRHDPIHTPPLPRHTQAYPIVFMHHPTHGWPPISAFRQKNAAQHFSSKMHWQMGRPLNEPFIWLVGMTEVPPPQKFGVPPCLNSWQIWLVPLLLLQLQLQLQLHTM